MNSNQPLDLRLVFVGYLILGVICAVWDWASRGSPLFAWTTSRGVEWWWLAVALMGVAAYFFLSKLLRFLTPVGKTLERFLQQLLTPISYLQIVMLALLSGFIEEWFFRGILNSHFGIVVSSLVFGLCHFIPAHPHWMWAIWTSLFGFVFAGIYEATESLWLCAIIHATINAVGLFHLNMKAYEAPSFR